MFKSSFLAVGRIFATLVIEDTKEIKLVSKGKVYIIDYSDIEWFELVEDNHSLAHSIENNLRNDQYETISKVDDSPLIFL